MRRTDEEDFYVNRERDSTPQTSQHRNSGGVEPFVRFFETELIPFVNRNYRTTPEDRTIVGHSITGFFCAYALLKHPHLFTRYLTELGSESSEFGPKPRGILFTPQQATLTNALFGKGLLCLEVALKP